MGWVELGHIYLNVGGLGWVTKTGPMAMSVPACLIATEGVRGRRTNGEKRPDCYGLYHLASG